MPRLSCKSCSFAVAASLVLSSTGAGQTPSLIPQQAGPLGGAPVAVGSRSLIGNSTSVQIAPPNFEKLRIAPGFLLHVSVLNEPQLTQDLRVDQNGDISVLLIGAVHVQGLSEAEAQAAIAVGYQRADMLKRPQVELAITQYVSPKISVLGQVQSPGEYELIAPTDLLAVLSMVGGTSADAGNRILLRHAGQSEQVIHYDKNGDSSILKRFTVQAGDTVVVKRAGIVYVLGAVNRPGGYVMQPDGAMTVIQALAFALDTTFYASTQDIRIVRKTDEGFITIPVRYKDLVSGKTSPQVLEPDDIVYIPTSKTKFALVNTKQLAFQASGAAIYAGVSH